MELVNYTKLISDEVEGKLPKGSDAGMEYASRVFDNMDTLNRAILGFDQGTETNLVKKDNGRYDVNMGTFFNYTYGKYSPMSRHLMFFEIMGLMPSKLREAYERGQLVTYGDSIKWAGANGLNLPRADKGEIKGKLSENFMIMDFVGIKDQTKTILKKMQDKGLTILSQHDMVAMRFAEAKPSLRMVNHYINNLGGIPTGDGWTYIGFDRKGQVGLEVRYNIADKVWEIRNGDNITQVRKYFYLSSSNEHGYIPTSAEAVFCLVLDWLFTRKDRDGFKGALAFMADVFVDKITVGFGDSGRDGKGQLEHFLENKVGMLQVALAGKGQVHNGTFMPFLQRGGDLGKAFQAYEAAGYTVFNHKTGRFIVVDAGMAGMARVDGRTILSVAVDKEAKGSGRLSLGCIPTAALWVEDDNDISEEDDDVVIIYDSSEDSED